MNILSIGNSFSTDAQRYLHLIAESAGEDIFAANLFIGGCPLVLHWENFITDSYDYDYEINGEFIKKISIKEALNEKKWDVITFQQASGDSGFYESFEPYIYDLIKVVKEAQPGAKLYLHKTWSYENGSEHPDFVKYGNDERKMFDKISEAYKKAREKTGLPVIPSGDLIQYLRENTNEFNMKLGGKSLTRDTFHLSYDYGRFAAGLLWFCVLTGKSPDDVTFIPVVDGVKADEKLIHIIKFSVFRFQFSE